jgi:hypothetical protein
VVEDGAVDPEALVSGGRLGFALDLGIGFIDEL